MERLDKVLTGRYPEFSRSRIEGLVKAGYVTVNGIVAPKAGMKVKAGYGGGDEDEIEVEIPPPVPAIPEGEDIPLDIVYEDEDIIVVNKAAGMVVHPAPGHYTGTLVNALLHHCPALSGIGGVARPGIVHRLDQYTSGLIIVAKSQAAMDGLTRAFASHKNVEKTYIAICHGRPGIDAGRIENLIGRHPTNRKKMAIVERNGKVAVTNWRLRSGAYFAQSHSLSRGVLALSKYAPNLISVIECKIETGRTHQIRVHMASLGCPVIGDAVYGKTALDKKLDPVPARQMLHAWKLKLWHPVKNVPMEFVAPPSADMRPYLPDL